MWLCNEYYIKTIREKGKEKVKVLCARGLNTVFKCVEYVSTLS